MIEILLSHVEVLDAHYPYCGDAVSKSLFIAWSKTAQGATAPCQTSVWVSVGTVYGVDDGEISISS